MALIVQSHATMTRFSLSLLALVALCVVVSVSAAPRPRRMAFPMSNARFAEDAPLDHRLPSYKTYWYTQTLDHFNFANTQTFQQRYLIAGM